MKVDLAWVDALLNRWGRWALRCESGALGFASSCCLGGGADGDGFDSAIPLGVIDDDMEAVNAAVRNLEPKLREIIMQVYQWGQGRSDRYNALCLHMDRKTLRKYLCIAHQKIVLDISLDIPQNRVQSVNGGNSPATIKPAMA